MLFGVTANIFKAAVYVTGLCAIPYLFALFLLEIDAVVVGTYRHLITREITIDFILWFKKAWHTLWNWLYFKTMPNALNITAKDNIDYENAKKK